MSIRTTTMRITFVSLWQLLRWLVEMPIPLLPSMGRYANDLEYDPHPILQSWFIEYLLTVNQRRGTGGKCICGSNFLIRPCYVLFMVGWGESIIVSWYMYMAWHGCWIPGFKFHHLCFTKGNVLSLTRDMDGKREPCRVEDGRFWEEKNKEGKFRNYSTMQRNNRCEAKDKNGDGTWNYKLQYMRVAAWCFRTLLVSWCEQIT